MKLTTTALKISAVAIALSLLAGCGPKLTQENFERVEMDMTSVEVKKLLGEPTEVETATLPVLGTVTTFSYETERSEATIVFHNDKVRTKTGSLSQ